MPLIAAFVASAFVCGVSALGCSRKVSDGPGLAAAQSREAQRELRQLEEEWELRGGAARAELRTRLENYIDRYGDDPSVARTRIMLAQIALYERRLGSAEEILKPLIDGPEGRTRDEAEVILAAIDNRRGNHHAALSRLEPLEGKLLTPEARDQYSRERTSAAIAARRWRLTVDAMTSWLTEAGGDSRAVEEWIESAIVQVPTRALSRLLADWEQKSGDPEEQSARDWVHRLIVEHLSREALRSRDPLLARDLLERSPPWLRAGESGDELAVLAALAQKEARVVGRGVGVVMGGQSKDERRRSVRVALGFVRGLNLGLGEGAPNGIQLLAAEDRGSMSSALGTLTGLGASILVAGVEQDGASEAIAFAQARKVPVVVMSEPRAGVSSPYGFVFGVGAETQKVAVQTNDAGRWVFVGDGGVSCSTQGARPTTTTLPVAEWREAGVDSVMVLGGAGCCRTITDQIARLSWSPRFVWGLECAHMRIGGGWKSERLSTADFPEVSGGRSDAISEREKELESGSAPPPIVASDWFFTLGVDAAKLIRQALLALPETQVTEREEVRKRHQLARSALLAARAQLMTTTAQGFNSSGRIDRALEARGDE